MQFYPFSAMLARMKYISRWGLMRSSRTESLCEHTADTALLAHTLALISVSIYGTQVRCETGVWRRCTTTPAKFSPATCPRR